jgi:FkbM family methyltransferase
MSPKSLLRLVTKLSRLVRSAPYRRGLRHKVGAAIEHEDAIRSLAVGTLIDVGANIGQFSLLTRAIHPGAVIHAFEPLSAMADTYDALFAGDRAATLHRVAAGETAGSAEINVSGRPDSSSLLPITAQQEAIFPGTAKASVETIRVERIDDILRDTKLPQPILVKLDVQGFELAALKGMPELLERAAHVYAEVSFVELYQGQPLAPEIIAWLAKRGFTVTGVHNLSFMANGATVQADMLFSRQM